MKLLFSTKEKLTIAGILIILILYIYIAQFYYLSPLKSDLANKQQTLQSQQQTLADLRQKVNSIKQNGQEVTTELQKEVPVKPLQDQFIIDLQHAELASSSQINSMSFSEGGQVSQTAAATNTTASSTSGSSAANTANGSSANSTTNSSANNSTSSTANSTTNSTTSQQASGSTSSTQTGSGSNTTAQQQNTTTTGSQAQSNAILNKLTVQLSVVSPSYEDFQKFINTLESLKRIVVVENISYSGPGEITSLSQNTQPFTYSLTVSAYYLPGLTDLESQLPKVDLPAPANKDNPLASFPDLTTP